MRIVVERLNHLGDFVGGSLSTPTRPSGDHLAASLVRLRES
jgi:hypothetical protein